MLPDILILILDSSSLLGHRYNIFFYKLIHFLVIDIKLFIVTEVHNTKKTFRFLFYFTIC